MASYWTSMYTPPTPLEYTSSVSDDGLEDGCLPVSVSTVFCPIQNGAYDLVIISSDGVLFALEKQHLLARSTNLFGGLLADKSCLSFMADEDSDTLNLALCAIRNIDIAQFRPSVDDLARMLAALEKYGIDLSYLAMPGSVLSSSSLILAISHPLEVYALICQHRLESLAVQISHYLLSISLSELTDDLCTQMGAVYLRRLLFLHLGRTERLKVLLQEPPLCHPPRKECDAFDQKCTLLKGWQDTVVSLACDIGPNTPLSLLHLRLTEFSDTLVCETCQNLTKERIRKFILDWATVKSTI